MTTKIKTHKICSRCHQLLPLEDFGNRKAAKDGKGSMCKTCTKEYYKNYNKEHKDNLDQIKKSWGSNHPKRFLIRNLRNMEWTLQEIGDHIGITKQAISLILANTDPNEEPDQTQSPNEIKDGELILNHCFVCNQKNTQGCAVQGVCAHCLWGTMTNEYEKQLQLKKDKITNV